jgi:sensor histidine kinase YesM
MFKEFIKYFPSRLFCLANLLFWLLLNTLAADNTHRTRLHWGRESDWLTTWVDYLPWWGNFGLLAPVIIACVRFIGVDGQPWWKLASKNIVLMIVAMSTYWGLTLTEVILLDGDKTLGKEAYLIAFQKLITSPIHMDLLVYLAIASCGFTMSYYLRAKEQAVNNQLLSNQLLKVELQSLKSQLSPHFLFNTLNTISGLIRLDHKDNAVKALSELSLMFRKVLENQKKQLTSLGDEIEFINSYLAIQKMRFENKLVIEMNFSKQSMNIQLPFMLLHTLVENSVQHGSQLESDQNLLKLVIENDEQHLFIYLTNKVAKREVSKGFGIGLDNCRQRLRHLYGDNYMLNCNETENCHFETILILPTGGSNA